MFSLEDIWIQAKSTKSTTYMDNSKDDKAVIHKGVKISKLGDKYTIVKSSTPFYNEIADEEYDIFLSKGWQIGRLNILMNDCEEELDKLFIKIRNCYQDNNRKSLLFNKARKEKVLSKYGELHKQLNQINGKVNENTIGVKSSKEPIQ
tara:strand:+ start:118 stop:561 length:444 start_codon:yes stop_codon:yes gene_type:complete